MNGMFVVVNRLNIMLVIESVVKSVMSLVVFTIGISMLKGRLVFMRVVMVGVLVWGCVVLTVMGINIILMAV